MVKQTDSADHRWDTPGSQVVDPFADRHMRPSSPRASKAPMIVIAVLLLLILAGGAVWWLRPDAVEEFHQAIAPTDQRADATPTTAAGDDPELQAMVDGWREEDAATGPGKPSEWSYNELVKLRDHRDEYRDKLLALEADYRSHERIYQNAADAGRKDRARLDAALVASHAKPIRAEIQRTEDRIAQMERDLGLSPGQVLEY